MNVPLIDLGLCVYLGSQYCIENFVDHLLRISIERRLFTSFCEWNNAGVAKCV